MGCYRCSARQVDPVRGPSRWRRGVVGGEQVLVCPSCQETYDWTADLDRCSSCGSRSLVRRLGETVCTACGTRVPAAASSSPPADPALADEVTAALDRVLRPD